MTNIGFLLAGAIGFAVGAQTLDRPESSKPLRAHAVVVMAVGLVALPRATRPTAISW
jgi:preprotein translocase subunit Sss1